MLRSLQENLGNKVWRLKFTNFTAMADDGSEPQGEAKLIQLVSVAFEPKTGMFRGTLRLAKARLGKPKGALVRYTWDHWRTYDDTFGVQVAEDSEACYFFFAVETRNFLCARETNTKEEQEVTLSFAICFQAEKNEDYWENNGMKNFEAHLTAVPRAYAPNNIRGTGRKGPVAAQSTISVC